MKRLKRKYNMIDPALILACQDVLDSIERDIAQFADNGFTPAKKTAFKNAIAAFDAMSSDNYLLGQQQVTTIARRKVRRICETKIRKVLIAAENIWGTDSTEYDEFTEDKRLSKLSDSELALYMEAFADLTEKYLAELADEGISAATVTELRNLNSEFEEACSLKRNARKMRTMRNCERIKKGNQLFALLNKYCLTGKSIWLGVNEAKYNDYIIYATPRKKTTATG